MGALSNLDNNYFDNEWVIDNNKRVYLFRLYKRFLCFAVSTSPLGLAWMQYAYQVFKSGAWIQLAFFW